MSAININQGFDRRVRLAKRGGGDLKVQNDQNFGQKLPKKTNFWRRKRRKFLKLERFGKI